MLLSDHFPPTMPAALEGRLTTRVPIEADVEAIVALVTADIRRHTPDGAADEEALRSRLVGLKSWARREVVVVPVAEDGSPSLEQPPLAWISLEDRADVRAMLQCLIASEGLESYALAGAVLDWSVEVGWSFARARGEDVTQLEMDINELDTDRYRLFSSAGYRMVRSWLHMR